MYIPLFLCMFFGVCLLCAGVKTDKKRDVALQGEKHKKGEGGTRALSDFSAYTEKIRKQREQKQKQRGKQQTEKEREQEKESSTEVEETETCEELVELTENDCATPL